MCGHVRQRVVGGDGSAIGIALMGWLFESLVGMAVGMKCGRVSNFCRPRFLTSINAPFADGSIIWFYGTFSTHVLFPTPFSTFHLRKKIRKKQLALQNFSFPSNKYGPCLLANS
jgi:hypothetical protein